MGRNEGLNALRAVVEVRISYAGRRISFPGVLLLRRGEGFRLELLDPLDRPVMMIFPDVGGLVQYRPSLNSAAVVGTFSPECRSLDSAAWVSALLAATPALVDGGEEVSLRAFFGRRYLERSWKGDLRQRVRYQGEGELRPMVVSWHCNDEPVLQLTFLSWQDDPVWRLPEKVRIVYLKAGLEIGMTFRETESNPPFTGGPLIPGLGPDTQWSHWNLLQ